MWDIASAAASAHVSGGSDGLCMIMAILSTMDVCHAAAHSSCQMKPMRCGRYWHERVVLEKRTGLLLAPALAPSRPCQDLQAVQPPASRLGCWQCSDRSLA